MAVAALWRASTSGARRRGSFRNAARSALTQGAELARPLRYNPSIEQVDEDESQTITELAQTMLKIHETTFKGYGHAVRATHAKSHGLLQGTLQVLDRLRLPWRKVCSPDPELIRW